MYWKISGGKMSNGREQVSSIVGTVSAALSNLSGLQKAPQELHGGALWREGSLQHDEERFERICTKVGATGGWRSKRVFVYGLEEVCFCQ